uniref:Uncharacterized protein n=1 Tax=Panagrellus redivivus TaxID=6233 RepID=A0A7E4UWG3_PANRE
MPKRAEQGYMRIFYCDRDRPRPRSHTPGRPGSLSGELDIIALWHVGIAISRKYLTCRFRNVKHSHSAWDEDISAESAQ